LELNVNELVSLPEELCSVKSLTDLCIDDNRIVTLPDSFGSLTNLSNFRAVGNRIISLPDSFAKLTSLQCIDLMFNRMKDFPSVIAALPQQIPYLALSGNGFESVPPEVEAKCAKVTVSDPDPPVEIVKDLLFLGSFRTSRSFTTSTNKQYELSL